MDITLWGRGSVHDRSGEKQRNKGGGEERRDGGTQAFWKAYKMSYEVNFKAGVLLVN